MGQSKNMRYIPSFEPLGEENNNKACCFVLKCVFTLTLLRRLRLNAIPKILCSGRSNFC